MTLLSRWNPFREIERLEPWQETGRLDTFREMDALHRQMNRLFDRLLPFNGGRDGGWDFIPSAELVESDEAFQLKVELPGLDPKDTNVEVTPDAVSISGERKCESHTDKEGYTRSEFHYGQFQRVIPLPTQVQNDKVQAEYKDGILYLTLPKAEAEKQKAVRVNLAQSG